MSEIKNKHDANYETMSYLEFYTTYCLNGDDGCDECEREGVCCIACKHQTDCGFCCDNQKIREQMLKMPTEEFAKMVEDADDESLVLDVAAERIRNDESRLQQLEAAVDALEELLEVAALRGDDCLPHPANDSKLWTARMQDAWDAAKDALAAAKEGRE